MSRAASLVAVAVAATLFLALALRQSGKPLQLDAVDLPLVARSLAAGDGPRLDRGLGSPAWDGLFLSPLAVGVLAGAFELLGDGARTAQLTAAAAGLVALLAALGLLGALLEPAAARRAAAILAPLALLQPYALQTFAVPTAATLVTAPLFALALLAFARLGWRAGEPRADPPAARERAIPALLFALLAASGPGPALLGLLAGAVLVPAWGWRRAGRATGAALLAGAELFVVGAMVVEVLGGVELGTAFAPYARAAGELRAALPGSDWPAHAAVSVPFHLRWTGLLPWVALAALALAGRARPAERALRTLAALVLGLSAATLLRTPGTYATVPFLDLAPLHALTPLAVAVLVARAWEAGGRSRRRIAAAVAVGLGALALGALAVGERVIVHGNLTGATLWPQAALLLVPGLLALAAFLPGGRRAAGPLLALGVAAQLGAQAGIALVQSGAGHSTSYNYGQSGMAAAAEHLRRVARPGDGVLCLKDLAYRLERPWWDSFPAFLSDEGERSTLRLLEQGRIRFAVFTDRYGQDLLASRPALEHWLGAHALGVERFGDYRVFELAPAATAAAAAPAP